MYLEKRDEVQEGIVAGVLGMDPDGPLHHRVLPHEHDRVAPQTPPDVLELVRADVVRGHDQDLAVLVQEVAQLRVVRDLLVRLRQFPHYFLRSFLPNVDTSPKRNRAKRKCETKLRAKTKREGSVKADSDDLPSL